jgi:hypothetical protein
MKLVPEQTNTTTQHNTTQQFRTLDRIASSFLCIFDQSGTFFTDFFFLIDFFLISAAVGGAAGTDFVCAV